MRFSAIFEWTPKKVILFTFSNQAKILWVLKNGIFRFHLLYRPIDPPNFFLGFFRRAKRGVPPKFFDFYLLLSHDTWIYSLFTASNNDSSFQNLTKKIPAGVFAPLTRVKNQDDPRMIFKMKFRIRLYCIQCQITQYYPDCASLANICLHVYNQIFG